MSEIGYMLAKSCDSTGAEITYTYDALSRTKEEKTKINDSKRKIVPTCNEDGDFEMLFIKDPTDQW